MKSFLHYLFRPYLDPGEEVLAVCHRHVFVMFGNLARILFFTVLIPLFLWYLFPDFAIFFILWMAIGCVKLFYAVFNWYHDALLITNVSLIRTGWDGLFNRTSTRLEYHVIEGISYAIQGVKKTVFNYGDVVLQRAGGSTISLPDAINPSRVERLIVSHQEKFVSDQNFKDADTLKNLLTEMVRQHAKTHGVPRPKLEGPSKTYHQ